MTPPVSSGNTRSASASISLTADFANQALTVGCFIETPRVAAELECLPAGLDPSAVLVTEADDRHVTFGVRVCAAEPAGEGGDGQPDAVEGYLRDVEAGARECGVGAASRLHSRRGVR